MVCEDGIKTDPEKIQALGDWPTHKCIKDVRKLLCFAGYYRRFVKGFAAIVRSLNDLLVGNSTKKPSKKRTQFNWKNPQQKAFDVIKEKLSNPPSVGFC